MIEVLHVAKRFGPVTVLSDLALSVSRAEVVALLGPSGCGKTTLLRILAGLERPDAGEVRLAGELVAGPRVHVPPEKRNIGLVFQDFALFPHLKVGANVAFGLAHLPRPERASVAAEALARLDCADLADRYPHELSGGQQQRVALARALAPRPRVLLMDEPFSNLDASLRRRLRVELRKTLTAIGIATVFVTHDQDEALSLADRVAVLDRGVIAQLDAPERVYRAPRSLAVARATGPVTTLPGRAAGGRVETALGTLSGQGPDGEVVVVLRPEDLVPAPTGVTARVVGRDYTGAEVELWLELPGGSVVSMRRPPRDALDATVGSGLSVGVDGEVAWVGA